MRWLLAFSLLGALASLAAARFISSARWLDALLATGGLLGLSSALAVAMLLRRWRARDWLVWAAIVVSAGAVATRAALLAELVADPQARQILSFWRLALAASSVVWGALALIWGTLLLGPALDAPRGRRGPLVVGVLATSASLYALAPLWTLLGLRINHLTVVGLFGLAVTAWLSGLAWQRLRSRSAAGRAAAGRVASGWPSPRPAAKLAARQNFPAGRASEDRFKHRKGRRT